jgi:hypothetical protein
MEKSSNENRDFFRDGADLAIVYISDEDEMSTGPSQATKAEDVTRSFQTLWQQTKTLQTYGLIIEPNDVPCLKTKRDEGSTAYYGRAVKSLTNATAGLTGSLCQSDYSKTLEQISKHVQQMANTFELRYVPDGPLKIKMIPTQDIPYKVEGKKIVFTKAPTAGTVISVQYKRKR